MPSLQSFDHPALAVDLAILTVDEAALKVVLARRPDAAEVGGDWALPGGFVHLNTALEDTVARVQRDKTGLTGMHFEQLATYGALGRDPRGHVVSVAYIAPTPAAPLLAALRGRDDLRLTEVSKAHALSLAFDHAALLKDIVARLRGKIDYALTGYSFLPAEFTLRDLQEVHEAVLGHKLTKPAFRRKVLDRNQIRATGRFETGRAYRPAELYVLKPECE